MRKCAHVKILADIDVPFLFKISLTLSLTFKARSYNSFGLVSCCFFPNQLFAMRSIIDRTVF